MAYVYAIDQDLLAEITNKNICLKINSDKTKYTENLFQFICLNLMAETVELDRTAVVILTFLSFSMDKRK